MAVVTRDVDSASCPLSYASITDSSRLYTCRVCGRSVVAGLLGLVLLQLLTLPLNIVIRTTHADSRSYVLSVGCIQYYFVSGGNLCSVLFVVFVGCHQLLELPWHVS